MIKPAPISNENARIEELKSLDLLDTGAEEAFDDIVKLASYISGCPVSLISLIDSDRQWFKAKIGTEVLETHRDISFCGHAIHQDEIFVIENALEDERFMNNPLVANDPSIRFYAGQPLITKNGYKIGTLCTIDTVPRKLTQEQLTLLSALAKQVSALIEKRMLDKKQNELNAKIKNINSNIELMFNKSQVIVAFMKGPEHRFEYVNPAHIKLLSGVDATGKTVREVQPEAEESGVIDFLNQVYFEGKTISFKDTPLRVGNEKKYFDFIYTPSFDHDGKVDGVMCVANDITSEKNLQLKLSMAIDISRVGFYEWDMIKNKVIFSEQMKHDWGINAETTLENILQIIHHEDQERVKAHIHEAIFKKIPYQIEYRVVRPDGKTVWIDARGTVTYNENDVAVAFLGTSVDITTQIEIRNDISRSLENLKEERDLRENFVAALTHDLRTPLTSARMSAQLLKAKNEKSSANSLARIISSMDRADNMIRDLLDASKIKVGEKLSFDIEECNLNSLIKTTIEDLTTIHGERFNVLSDDKIVGYWDQDIVRRILENLTNNAIKYGADDTPITIALNRDESRIELSVHNLGNPILDEDPMTLFQPYRRSVNTNSQKGWGIGLTLVKGFTESLGGNVKVSSSNHEGTIFSIILPEDSRHHIN